MELVDSSNPLLVAARSGRLAHAQRLLADGANPNVHTAAGWTPIHSAAYNGHVGIVKLLIQHHADLELKYTHWADKEKVERTPLQQACLRNHPEVVEALLDAGAHIDAGPPANSPPLVSAAKNGYTAIVRLLLDHKANVNASKHDGWSALHAASFHGHISVIMLLIQFKADLTALFVNSRTPLHKAAEKDHAEAVALLLDSGADIDERTNEGFSALYIAALKGSEAVARLLLERGAHADSHSTSGWMPLHTAAKRGYPSIVQLLLSHDAPIEAKVDVISWTPLHYAASEGRSGIVGNLLDYGANIEANTSNGSTALHLAVAKGHQKVVTVLLDRQANFKARRKDTKTPLALAIQNNHSSITTLLSSLEPDDDLDVSELVASLPASTHDGMAQQPADVLAGGTQSTENWLRKIDFLNQLIEATPKPKGARAARIAVLDTGCSLDGGYFSYPRQRQRLGEGHWHDFAGSSPKPIDDDLNKHGTMVSSLVLKVARNADVFVARIATKASELASSEEKIVKAIEYAQDPEGWGVDIVCMSFGFRSRVESIQKCISTAAQQRPILFFAAAANNGSNERELFPAYLNDVISVRGTDSLGSFVGAYDPPPMHMNEGLPLCGTLGQNVPYAPGENSSGCSVAAPIMAGMVAIIMHWMAYKSDKEDAKRKLCTAIGIRELLKAEAIPKGNNRYYFHLGELFVNNGARCVGAVEAVMSRLP